MQLFDDAARESRTIGAILGPLRGFDDELTRALKDALPAIDTRPKSVEAADRAQSRLIDIFDAHGHRAAAFLKVYHGITVAVIEALDQGRLGPRFFFERLPGHFAERHFDGVKAELGLDTTSDAAVHQLWRPSFAFDNLAPRPDALGLRPPLAHFTVGMCIHINLDLAAALDETLRELEVRDPRVLQEVERGHEFVDTILEEKVAASTELLAAEMDCPMSKRIIEAGAVRQVGEQSMATIRRWRKKTFPNALALATAAGDEERARVRAEIYRAGARKTVLLFNTLPDLIQGTLSGSWWATSS